MVITADIHLGLISDSVRGEDNFPSKLIDMRTRLFELIDESAKTDGILIVAGDLFEIEDPRGLAMLIFFQVADYAKSKGVILYITPGNHDTSSTWCSLSPLKEARLPHVKIIDRPKLIKLGGLKVLFIPHLPKQIEDSVKIKFGTYNHYLKQKYKRCDLLITHAHKNGATTSSDIEFGAGEAMTFNPKEVPTFKIAILGHIHKHQNLPFNGKPILYPGSIVVNDFGEVGDTKGYITLDENLDWKFKRFRSSVKRYKLIQLDMLGKTSIELSDSQAKKMASGCLLKVVVIADKAGSVNESQIRRTLNKYGHVIRFQVKTSKSGITESSIRSRGAIASKLPHKTLLSKWLQGQDKLSRSCIRRTTTLGQEILEEVL